MIELSSEYLSVRCIRLYVLAMSRTRFLIMSLRPLGSVYTLLLPDYQGAYCSKQAQYLAFK